MPHTAALPLPQEQAKGKPILMELKNKKLVAISAAFLFPSIFSIIVRVWTRLRLVRRLGTDDILILPWCYLRGNRTPKPTEVWMHEEN
jgi:hypothetical protein